MTMTLSEILRGNDVLGLPRVFPEAEVLAADLSRIRCLTLADTIAHLIAEHEPMLRAEADGPNVSVRVVGDPEVMRFTVTESPREAGEPNKPSASNS